MGGAKNNLGGHLPPPPPLPPPGAATDSKGRRFDSHRGQAYFSSLPGVDIHSE